MAHNSIHAAFLCGVLGLGAGTPVSALAADTPVQQQSLKGLRVTFLMYSGRPNPSVTVTDLAQVRAIEERLARSLVAAPLSPARTSFAVLGYTGIKVERLGAAPPEVTAFVVKRDELRVEDAEPSVAAEPMVTVSRAALELEDFLLALGREQGVLDDVGLFFIRDSK